MNIQKLTVIRAKLSREKLVRFKLNCARNDKMFTGILKRLDLEIEEDESHHRRKYPQ